MVGDRKEHPFSEVEGRDRSKKGNLGEKGMRRNIDQQRGVDVTIRGGWGEVHNCDDV